MKELKDIKLLHPMTIAELSRVPTYYPFEWQEKRLRCVKVREKATDPCRHCNWEKERNRSIRCPMANACMASFRKDRMSVKFISDELSSLNLLDKETLEMARKVDELCYKN